MKNYYLLLWLENENNSTKRRHAWYKSGAEALKAYRMALDANRTDVIVLEINTLIKRSSESDIDQIRLLIDGSPF